MNNMIRHSFRIVFMNLTIGCIFLSESNCLSKLNKLTHLDLSWTHFDKENLRFLGALPVLKSLDLTNTRMAGPLSGKGMYIYEFSSSTTYEEV